MEQRNIGYVALLRRNKPFRRLFTAVEISYIGDWFTVIALFLLSAQESDNSPLAIAGVLAARSFSMAFLEPITGMFADRYSRKKLMILSCLSPFLILSAVIMTGFISSLLSIYIVTVAITASRALFDPAEYAYVPNICTKDELLTANAITSGGWSVALGIGASIGGYTIATFGTDVALLVDVCTYFLAMLLLMTLPEGGPTAKEEQGASKRSGFSDIAAGWNYVRKTPEIRRIIGLKGAWAVGGGAQVFLLVLIGDAVQFGQVATGIGLLYMARGLGSGFGPVAFRRIMNAPDYGAKIILVALCLCGGFYLVVAGIPWAWYILVFVFLSHAASGINWVLSTTILQKRSEDEWRGRVAGTDFFLITLIMGISALVAGGVLEYTSFSVRLILAVTALLQIAAGVVWFGLYSTSEQHYLHTNSE